MTLYHGAITSTSRGIPSPLVLDRVAPLFAPPERLPRSSGYGWTCPCHGAAADVWRVDEGWVTTGPADTCPRRRAVSPSTTVVASDVERIRGQPPVVAMVAPSPGLEMPADVHRLIPRLLNVGVTPGRYGWLTYSLHWWSVAVPLDAPDEAPPPDADRVEEDERDGADLIELPTGEVVKRKGRTTRDVAILRESLALRAWPVGVVLWLRRLDPAAGKKVGAWIPDGGYVNQGGVIVAGGIKAFKAELKIRESK